MKKPFLWTAAATAVALVLVGLLLPLRKAARGESPPSSSPVPSPADAHRSRSPVGSSEGTGMADGALGGMKDMRELVAYLHQRYGAHIKSPYIQIRMLEKLIGYYRARSPEGWEQAVLEVLRAAFPERYEELAANLRHWVEYERWMKENQGDLQRLGADDRRANLWDERNRLFGKEAAEQIWASEVKNQAVANALATLDAQGNTTVSEKLAMYKKNLGDVYGEESEAFLERHRHEAMMRFLDLQSVQRQLTAMAPEQRAQNLREIRAGMGLEEEALKRWEGLDRERDERWAIGAKYMDEREALAKKYAGAALDEQFQTLRQRYFGAEAETIAHEEQTGFFRFSRPRVWGRD